MLMRIDERQEFEELRARHRAAKARSFRPTAPGPEQRLWMSSSIVNDKRVAVSPPSIAIRRLPMLNMPLGALEEDVLFPVIGVQSSRHSCRTPKCKGSRQTETPIQVFIGVHSLISFVDILGPDLVGPMLLRAGDRFNAPSDRCIASPTCSALSPERSRSNSKALRTPSSSRSVPLTPNLLREQMRGEKSGAELPELRREFRASSSREG